MQETLGGGDVEDEVHANQAAERLQFLGRENLDKMADIHTGGNKDDKELGVIARARGLAAGQSAEAAGLSAELTQRIGDQDVDGELLDKISNASGEDRLSVLSNLQPEQLEQLAYHGTDHEDQMGNLMAALVQDAGMDPRAAQVVGAFTNGLKDSHNRDDVLQRMQEKLGGGDVEISDNRRAAARALSVLDPTTLDKMSEIHGAGNKDDKELDVVELARELQA
jgi:hypothetical protein